MRVALAILLVAAFVLAGCAAPKKNDAGAAGPEGGGDSDRQSQPGSGTARDDNTSGPPQKEVALVDGPIQIIGQGSASFDAVIPDNTSRVTFLLTSNNELLADGLAVSLDGCGQTSQSGVNSGTTPGGATVLGGIVCGAAAPGKHQVTVSNTGFIDGTFQLLGQVPDNGNATASA